MNKCKICFFLSSQKCRAMYQRFFSGRLVRSSPRFINFFKFLNKIRENLIRQKLKNFDNLFEFGNFRGINPSIKMEFYFFLSWNCQHCPSLSIHFFLGILEEYFFQYWISHTPFGRPPYPRVSPVGGEGGFRPQIFKTTRKTKGTKVNQLSLNNLKQPKVFAKSSIPVVSYCFIVVFVQCPAISYQLSGDIEPNGPFSPFVQKIWWSYGFFLILYRKMVFLGKESKTLRFQRKTRGTCSISFDIHRHYFFYFILTVTYSRLPKDLNIFYSKAQVASGGGGRMFLEIFYNQFVLMWSGTQNPTVAFSWEQKTTVLGVCCDQ